MRYVRDVFLFGIFNFVHKIVGVRKLCADVHALLMGVFGYTAYPLFLGAVYLCIMGLLGKSLVKNKKAGWLIGITLYCLALVIHTALTLMRFDKAGYLTYCFEAGAAFPAATVTGWVGGLLVFALAKLVTQIGVLVLFSLLTLLFGYVSFVALKKADKNKAERPKNAEEPSMDIPLSNEQDKGKTQDVGQASNPSVIDLTSVNVGQNVEQTAQQAMPSYSTPTVAQRPGVRLYENQNEASQNAQNQQSQGGFSPFGNAQQVAEPVDELASSYERSRAFLFGGTPAENYRKNLLFDPNANVNKRPSVEPSTPSNTYVPSYVNAYENSVNNATQPVRPIKVVSDNTQNASNYGSYGERENSSFATPVTPIAPVAPIEPAEEMQKFEERTSYSAFESRLGSADRGESLFETPTTPVEREEQSESTEDTSYRRHDYMDLFSTSNPNVFGREENARDSFVGSADREIAEETERDFMEEARTKRSGLHLLDDEEEIPTARGFDLDLSSDRTSARGDFSSERLSFPEEDEEETRGGLFSDRGAREVDIPSPFDVSAPVSQAQTEPIKSVAEPAPVPIPKKPRVIRPYVKIPLDDLDCRDIESTSNFMEVEETKQNIISTLEEFKVTGASIASVTHGPTVTRYNVTIPRHISPKKVVALDESIAISLRSNGVNVYPNYEDGVVSIEVPNKERQFVQLGCMLSGNTFVNAKSSSLMFAMGKDVANKKIYGDISKMIHLLVAGSSGSGKSVFLGALIISLIYKYSPEELRLILIDPKKTEFVLYNDLPHLMINEIITDVGKAVQSLNWAIGEMNRRYSLFEQMSRSGKYVVNLDQYNENMEKKDRLPKIVIIIDELADLMLAAKKEMEDRIQNLTQKARAAGIHLIVATQRPSTDVITGVIKSNLPTRVAFYVASDVDSRVILDQTGAQKLLGKGDFLYTMPGLAAPARVQSAFISPEESQKVVNFIKNNNEAYYDEEATAFINSRGGSAGGDVSGASSGEKELDPMNIEALRHVIMTGSASISMIQRKCSAGYNRAGKIVEWMEDMGYISPFDGAKARKVLITKEEFESKYGPL